MTNYKTSYLTKGSMLTAIGVLLVYISSVVPLNKSYILIIASALVPLAVIIGNIKTGLLVYLSTGLLSFLICGLKPVVIAYLLFFGMYGLIKYYIERLNKLFIEALVKISFFNIMLFTIFNIGITLFYPNINFKVSGFILILVCEIGFIFYDYALTVFIGLADKKIKNHLT